MKRNLTYFLILFISLTGSVANSQNDTVPPVEPNMETSFDNMELLVIALVGLALLMLLYFFFRNRRKG